MTEREKLLKQVMAYTFAAIEWNLYLNTHPDDKDGIAMFKKMAEKVNELRKEYSEKYEPLTASEVKKHFEGRLTFDKHRFCDSADVTVTGVTKADGVRAILGVLEVDPDNTYAFGDGSNDIEMFKAVKHSVAMGVSAQNVKDAAEYITASVEDEGIYRALEKYGLI